MLNPAATHSRTTQLMTVSALDPRPVQIPRRMRVTVQSTIVVWPVN
jgi:hypothetical protein